MAYEAKDGKRFTNRPPMMAHNRSIERGGAATMEKTDPTAQPGESQGGEMDGHAMAREHGPAVEVNVMHDHEGGRHMVHARHADGHEHQSEHGSAEEAHEHGKACAGCGMEEEGESDGMDEPEYE